MNSMLFQLTPVCLYLHYQLQTLALHLCAFHVASTCCLHCYNQSKQCSMDSIVLPCCDKKSIMAMGSVGPAAGAA